MDKLILISLAAALCLSVVTVIPQMNDHASAQSTTMQGNGTATCENNTSSPSNYLTLTCTNSLIKTNDTITNVGCDTSTGWIVLCAWQQQANQTNGTSPSQISVSSSMDGGQSFNNTIINFSNSTSPAKNPKVGLALDYGYILYEQVVSPGNNDVFLASSHDGGISFDQPVNLSNSTYNSIDSKLIVDEFTGKVLAIWTEQGDDRVKVYCSRC